LGEPVPDQEAAAEGQRGEERGGATGGAQVPGVQHLERRKRAAHRAKSSRQIQDASPGQDPPDTGDQPTAADRRPDAIPHWMARLLRLLPDPTRAHEPGSVDPPKITLVSLAAMAERAQSLQRTAPSWRAKVQCSSRRRFTDGVLAHVRTPGGPTSSAQPLFRLIRSPPTPCRCPSLTRSNRRGTDPYARWWGRGGTARCPPIPIFGAKASLSKTPAMVGSPPITESQIGADGSRPGDLRRLPFWHSN